MNERLLEIRNSFHLNQEEFGERIGLSKASISALEGGSRNLTDRHIMLLRSELDVNEDWLRTGDGEMFVQSETFSLDEQAKKSNLTELEIAIMRGYMELDHNTREDIVTKLESIIQQRLETAATVDPIEAELESYRKELVAEQKGETLSASRVQSESS